MQFDHGEQKIIDGTGKKIGFVVSRFNEQITEQLLAHAKQYLAEARVEESDCQFISVAGAVEIPFALQHLANTKLFDGLVALGCIIRGETPHFDYVCKMAQEGVLRISLDERIPIGFGVLTVNTIEQAQARFQVGAEAVAAVLELSNLKKI